jgi:hypothetical protein
MSPTLAQRRAAGQLGTAALLERHAHLRLVAERVAPPLHVPRLDPIAAAAELRRTVGALRVLNARRELRRCHEVLRADPAPNPTVVARVAQIGHYLGDLERDGRLPCLPWDALLDAEERLPQRRPRRTVAT